MDPANRFQHSCPNKPENLLLDLTTTHRHSFTHTIYQRDITQIKEGFHKRKHI